MTLNQDARSESLPCAGEVLPAAAIQLYSPAKHVLLIEATVCITALKLFS